MFNTPFETWPVAAFAALRSAYFLRYSCITAHPEVATWIIGRNRPASSGQISNDKSACIRESSFCRFCRTHSAVQLAESTSAGPRTVNVAFSCLSGG